MITGMTRPVRDDSILTHEVSGEIVLYDPQNEAAVGLNLTAAAIWDLCDGTNSVEQIAASIAGAVGQEVSTVTMEVERVLRELVEMGLVGVREAGSRAAVEVA